MKDYSLEAAKKAKKLQFVPLIMLFLRTWGMIRYYIYITSSVNESESVRKFQVALIYIQVRLLCPNSDQHQISPCNITTSSTPELMRIKDMIT